MKPVRSNPPRCAAFLRAGYAALVVAAMGCSDEPAETAPNSELRLVYASAQDSFVSWPSYVTEGSPGLRISRAVETSRGPASVTLTALGQENVGVNKGFQTLRGRLEFEFQVKHSDSVGENIAMFVIPMQQRGILEVGTDIPNDPKNGFSKHRLRYVIPRHRYLDGEWTKQVIEFDFSSVPKASFVVVAPRINEGATEPAAAQVTFRNLRVFAPGGQRQSKAR